MASITKRLVDWVGLNRKVLPEYRQEYLDLKSKYDKTAAKAGALPPALPPLDWDYYSQNLDKQVYEQFKLKDYTQDALHRVNEEITKYKKRIEFYSNPPDVYTWSDNALLCVTMKSPEYVEKIALHRELFVNKKYKY